MFSCDYSNISPGESDSSDSEDEEQESPRLQSTSSSGSDEDRIVFSEEPSTTTSPIKRQTADSNSNKMDIDTSNSKKHFNQLVTLCSSIQTVFFFIAWNAFETNEVAMDETVSMDASDVGWDRAPANNTPDTGWANFDNFTDIGMAGDAP